MFCCYLQHMGNHNSIHSIHSSRNQPWCCAVAARHPGTRWIKRWCFFLSLTFEIGHQPKINLYSWWLNQPNWKILVKLDHFPPNRDENKPSLETNTYSNTLIASFLGRNQSDLLRSYHIFGHQVWSLLYSCQHAIKYRGSLNYWESFLCFLALFQLNKIQGFLGLGHAEVETGNKFIR